MASSTGGCLCGQVRFTAEDVEYDYHVCHCGMCRRWASAPLFAAAVGKVEFESRDQMGIYDSSKWAERGFCKHCGSNLFYRLKSTGDHIMCVGAFDDPTPFKLVGEIYVDHQPEGYRFAGELTRMTEAETIAEFAPSE